MSTLVLVQAVIQPGRLEDAIAFLAQRFPETRDYTGCQSIETFVDESSRTIAVVQHWDSEQAFNTYFAWRQETGSFDEFMTMLEEDPDIRAFAPVLT